MHVHGQRLSKELQQQLKERPTGRRIALLLALIGLGVCVATTIFLGSNLIDRLASLLAKLWLEWKLR
jgi:hypothetical protein